MGKNSLTEFDTQSSFSDLEKEIAEAKKLTTDITALQAKAAHEHLQTELNNERELTRVKISNINTVRDLNLQNAQLAQIAALEEEKRKTTDDKKRKKLAAKQRKLIQKLTRADEAKLEQQRLSKEQQITDLRIAGLNASKIAENEILGLKAENEQLILKLKTNNIGAEERAALLVEKKRLEGELKLQEIRLKGLTAVELKELEITNAQKAVEEERQQNEQSSGLEVLNQIYAERNKLDQAAEAAYQTAIKDKLEAEIAAAAEAAAANGEVFGPEQEAEIAKKYKFEGEAKKKFLAAEEKKQKKEKAKTKGKELREAQKTVLDGDASIVDRFKAMKDMTTTVGEDGEAHFDGKKALASSVMMLDSAISALGDFSKKIDKQVEEIASNKAAIDTRLQGSKSNETSGGTGLPGMGGSYWEKMSDTIIGIGGASPLYKQEEIVKKVQDLVGKGISYNVTQRAFLQTISEKIATTFDASNGTLLRLVRIQQKDTTAGRLGMESALNSFLNSMYETTEYMNDMMTSVKSNIEESMALMGGEDAVAFEYQVQKWMGSLYSVGMSNNAVSGISAALGKLAAGDIEGLMGSGTGNLMVMAANEANLSLSDMLAQGLDESSTNRLMQAMVNYLADIYNEAEGSKVVQQQIANVYGVAASDLKAATNLANNASTMNSVFGNASNYSESIAQLNSMANSMATRTSTGELLNNAMANLQYSMAEGMASSPVLYGLSKTADMLNDLVGGIALPFINVMGFGVDLNTSVADLMKVGAMAGGILSNVPAMFAGGGGMNAAGALQTLGVTGTADVVSRGEVEAEQSFIDRMKASGQYENGVKKKNARGRSTSSSGSITTIVTSQEQEGGSNLVGNANGGDVKDATMTSASNDTNSQMVEAKESEDAATTSDIMDEHIVDIYNLLQEVLNGEKTFHTKLDDSTISEIERAVHWTSVGGI